MRVPDAGASQLIWAPEGAGCLVPAISLPSRVLVDRLK